MNKSDVKSLLNEGVVEFVFEKADGTESVMNGSLKPELLPPMPEPVEGEEPKEKKVYTTNFPLYNVEKQAWRSIVWDRLKTVNGEPFDNE